MNSKLNFSLVCLECGETYNKDIKYSLNRYKTFRFCSRNCYKKHGDKTWYKKFHKGMKGKNNPGWLGDDCSYSSLHAWVHRWKKKKKFCEHCGKKGGKHKTGKSILEAANISGNYKRDLDDWIWLCTPCHMKMDKGRNSIAKFIATGRNFNK